MSDIVLRLGFREKEIRMVAGQGVFDEENGSDGMSKTKPPSERTAGMF